VTGGVVTGEVSGVFGAPPFCVLVGVPPVDEVGVDPEPDDDVEPEVDPAVEADAAAPDDPLSEPPQPLNKPVNATARAATRKLKVNMAEP